MPPVKRLAFLARYRERSKGIRMNWDARRWERTAQQVRPD
jgi:hypothetical protein